MGRCAAAAAAAPPPPPQALRAGSGVLRRLGTELLWRGLLVAGLAGWLYSTWQTAGVCVCVGGGGRGVNVLCKGVKYCLVL